MNTTATYSSENSLSRRCSTETVFSIQGKETDFARDTSDSDGALNAYDSDLPLEYEPASEEEEEAPLDDDTSASFSDGDIIKTKVLEVRVDGDGDLQFADSEQTDSQDSDSETDLFDYWHCLRCRTRNHNPFYRYCHKCFQVRKSFFPPRPKRKRKREATKSPVNVPRTLSQDSGVESINSQELGSQDNNHGEGTSRGEHDPFTGTDRNKRRAESVDRKTKRTKTYNSDSDSDSPVQPLVKTVSDPAITIDKPVKITKKVVANTLKEKLDSDLCIVCISEPKSGVFVHGRIAHICCCYKCAVKVWTKAKRCPVCNCKVSNVLKAVVM